MKQIKLRPLYTFNYFVESYSINSQSLTIEHGILSKTVDYQPLNSVIEVNEFRSFVQILFGLATVELVFERESLFLRSIKRCDANDVVNIVNEIMSNRRRLDVI